MKDEFMGKIIYEFFGLKSNIYSLIEMDSKEINKAKGVNKNILKNLKHKKYIDALFNKKKNCHIASGLKIFVKFLCLVLMINSN